MFEKSLETRQFWKFLGLSFKMSYPDSLGVKMAQLNPSASVLEPKSFYFFERKFLKILIFVVFTIFNQN